MNGIIIMNKINLSTHIMNNYVECTIVSHPFEGRGVSGKYYEKWPLVIQLQSMLTAFLQP